MKQSREQKHLYLFSAGMLNITRSTYIIILFCFSLPAPPVAFLPVLCVLSSISILFNALHVFLLSLRCGYFKIVHKVLKVFHFFPSTVASYLLTRPCKLKSLKKAYESLSEFKVVQTNFNKISQKSMVF